MTHICVGNLTIIGSDNGLSPDRRQAIIWANAGILLIGPWGTHFSEIVIGIQAFSFTKMHLKMASAKWRPFCPGLNVLTQSMISPSSHMNTIVKKCMFFNSVIYPYRAIVFSKLSVWWNKQIEREILSKNDVFSNIIYHICCIYNFIFMYK